LNSGENIDFKRKAGSLVDNTGDYFATNSDPFAVFEAGCNFLRQVGKSQGGTINAILGSTALANLLANTKFTARQNLFNMALDAVRPPQRDSVGATLHGQITAGSYKVNLWAYPEFYDTANGTSTPYMDPKKVILLPEAPKFTFAYAAVPKLIDDQSIRGAESTGAYTVKEFMDSRKATHDLEISSAGLPIPVAIDQIYTFKAVS
jgi:hypothetical protein